MDKYEYNIKAEQINKMIENKDYATAAKIADGIEWKRVKSINMLTKIGNIYAQIGRYEDAKEIYLLAFQRAPMGRRLAYKLAEISIALGNLEEAEMYYNEFREIAPKDTRHYELLYWLEKKRGKSIERLIEILEEYKENEFDDMWSYELARLYHKAGMAASCITECDEIILWFGEGEYVERAKELKMLYVPPDFKKGTRYKEHYYSPSVSASEKSETENTINRIIQKIENPSELQHEKQIANDELYYDDEEGNVNLGNYGNAQPSYDTEFEENLEDIREKHNYNAERDYHTEKNYNTREIHNTEENHNIQENYSTREDYKIDKAYEGEENSNTEDYDTEDYNTEDYNTEDYNTEDYNTEDYDTENYDTENDTEGYEPKKDFNIEEEKFDTEEAEPIEPEEKSNIYRIPRKYLQMEMPLEEIIQKYGKPVEASEKLKEKSLREETKVLKEEIQDIVPKTENIEKPSITDSLPPIEEKERTEELSYHTKIRLSEEKKQTFAKFLHINGLEEQLAEIFKEAEQIGEERSTSLFGNLIIIGEHKTGKTSLGVEILKELNKINGKKGKKIAKISGGRLNNKEISETIARLSNADLLVEQAGEINKTTIRELLNAMAGYTGGMVVVLEDTREDMERLLTENPEIKVRFNHEIILKEYDIAEWVKIAKEYARELEYGIDEMATLALSAKIDNIYAKKTNIEIEDIQKIIQEAIEKSEKKNLKKLFDTVFSRKYKNSDLTILREADFE